MLPALAFAAAIFLSAAAEAQPSAEEARVRIIVNPANEVSSLSRAEASAIFMRRLRSWPDGTEILPVDQPARSRVRRKFSRSVHGKSVAYVTRYWQRLIFSGRGIPPREAADDSAVIDLVRSHRGAIGYVEETSLPAEGVKLVEVTP